MFSSSCTVYGQPEEIPVTEAAPTGAESPYGWTKYMSEQILRDVAATSALNAVLLRYFNPVGAHASGTLGEDPNGIPNNLVPYVMQVAVGRLESIRVFGGDYETPDGTGTTVTLIAERTALTTTGGGRTSRRLAARARSQHMQWQGVAGQEIEKLKRRSV